MKRLFGEVVLFGAVGTTGFVVDTAVLYALRPFLGNYTARAISFLCAVVVTWLLNRNLTFRHKTSRIPLGREFLRYLGMMVAGGAINYLTYAILVAKYEFVHQQPVWGVAAGSLAGMVVNYLQLRLVMFRHMKIRDIPDKS